MDEEFDVVICGTGLKECILGGLLSVQGKRVLQVDRHGYYGGESASLNLTNLFERFQGPGAKPPAEYGPNRDWNVDLIPKFVMSSGVLVRLLLYTKVTRYLEWQVVEGTYVYQHQQGGFFSGEKYVHKVPATDVEALKSPLMPLLEKNRCRQFFQFVMNYDKTNPSTYKGYNPTITPMRKVYEDFGLQQLTTDFLGHAVALYPNDEYLDQPMGITIEKMRLYMFSIARYGKSPFIYPVYGLSTLPEGFSRLCAVHGGVFMLNTPIAGFEFDSEGRVCGVRSAQNHDQVAKCKMVICDPSYVLETMPHKLKHVGKVIRAICITRAPPKETQGMHSSQIIIPQNQLGRKHDIYIATVSSKHGVAHEGKFVSLVSTTVETDNPEQEIQPAIERLQNVEHKFVQVSDLYEPTDDGQKDNIYVSKSYDATSHFESALDDVLDMYQRIAKKPLDLSVLPEADDE